MTEKNDHTSVSFIGNDWIITCFVKITHKALDLIAEPHKFEVPNLLTHIRNSCPGLYINMIFIVKRTACKSQAIFNQKELHSKYPQYANSTYRLLITNILHFMKQNADFHEGISQA